MRKLTPASGEPVQVNPYDINSPDFDADIYGQFLVFKNREILAELKQFPFFQFPVS